MKFLSLKHLVIGLCMFAAAGLAMALKPTVKMADSGPGFDLEVLIPKAFGEWKIDETIVPLIANPEQDAQLEKLYSQTLSRTYVNSKGERIMLSIAYGGEQSRTMQVHRPEVCYTAQGFQVGSMQKATINLNGASLPVMKLVATQGPRTEPIIYWVNIGGDAVRGNLEQGFARLRYGLTGKVPDGLLFRVSAISEDLSQSYADQEIFVRDLLGSLTPEQRVKLTGAI
jgi:EpsI family protein